MDTVKKMADSFLGIYDASCSCLCSFRDQFNHRKKEYTQHLQLISSAVFTNFIKSFFLEILEKFQPNNLFHVPPNLLTNTLFNSVGLIPLDEGLAFQRLFPKFFCCCSFGVRFITEQAKSIAGFLGKAGLEDSVFWPVNDKILITEF